MSAPTAPHPATPHAAHSLPTAADVVGRTARWAARAPAGPLPLAGILAVGLGLRFYRLDDLPGEFYGDIAIIYEYVGAVLGGRIPYSFFLSNGPLYGYVIAPIILALGQQGYLPYKLASVLVSLSGLGATFLFVRAVADRPTALLAAFFMAVNSWYLVFSRLGNAQVIIPSLAALSYYLLVSGVHRASSFRPALGIVVACLGLYEMPQTFVLPVAYLLSAAFLLPARRLPPLLALAMLCAVPFGLIVASQPELFFSQAGYIGSKVGTEARPLARIGENVIRSLLMLHVEGDVSFRGNPAGLPHLDPLSGLAFMIGLLAWLRKPRTVLLPLLLVPLAILLLPANLVLSEIRPTPSASRSIAILPFVALAVASGIRLAVDRLKSLSLRAALLSLLLVSMLAWNALRYFDDYARGLPDRNTPFGKIIAATIDALPAEMPVVVASCCWGEWGQPEPTGIYYVLQRPREVRFLQAGRFTCAHLDGLARPLYIVWDPRDLGSPQTPPDCDDTAEPRVFATDSGATMFVAYVVAR